MTRLVHLSDLHFGRTTEALLEPLLREVVRQQPDAVIISGDLTQRARHRQFAEAAAFIARLRVPVLTVPGNHDTPLDNLFVRFFAPWHRYRRHINEDLEPVLRLPGAMIVGLNTANPYAWKQGRITPAQLRRIEGLFGSAGSVTRMLVMHHPLEHAPGQDEWLMRGAEQALVALPDIGAEVVLSGHVHVSHAGPFNAAPGLLLVQAGTGLSSRTRTERNAFNVLDLRPDTVDVRTVLADEGGVFRERASLRYRRAGGLWRPDDQLPR